MELLSRVSHPAIMPILEVVDSGSGIFTVMPFVSGSPLTEWIQSHRRMDSRQVAELVAELAEALHLVHGLGLIHGDLKTANILIGDDGRPRLLDFGDNLQSSSQDPAETDRLHAGLRASRADPAIRPVPRCSRGRL